MLENSSSWPRRCAALRRATKIRKTISRRRRFDVTSGRYGDSSMRLWRDQTFAPPTFKKRAIRTVRRPMSFFQQIVSRVLEFLVGLYFKPPKLNPTVQAKVDEIIVKERASPLSVTQILRNV